MKIPRRPLIKVIASKPVLSVILRVVVLLVLVVGGATAYIWFTGHKPAKDVPKVAAATDPTARPFFEPTKPDPEANVGVAVQLITSPTTPGSNASISIRSYPGSVCEIKVKYKEVASTDSGLVTKTADEYGVATWSWSIEPTVPLGKWPVAVTCTHHEKTGMVVADLVVTK